MGDKPMEWACLCRGYKWRECIEALWVQKRVEIVNAFNSGRCAEICAPFLVGAKRYGL